MQHILKFFLFVASLITIKQKENFNLDIKMDFIYAFM